MRQEVKEALDKLTAKIAADANTSEKFVNICVNIAVLSSKLGVIAMFSKSATLNLEESINSINQDTSSIIMVAAALAGLTDPVKVRDIYQEVATRVAPILQTAYSPPSSQVAS